MDSLTQIVLGAACGEVILGKQLGNKAMLLGAVAGTIPDLDVIYSLFDSDPIAQLEVHRGYSHSMFTHLLLAWFFAWLSKRWSKRDITFSRWYMFWFAGFFTHALLDCCTSYGTRLLLPFTDYQVGFNNISVVDPLYTVPFLLILMVCLFIKRDRPLRRKFLWASITVSSAYMLLTFGLKWSAFNKFEQSLAQAGISYDELDTTPSILNAILWSASARNDSILYCAEYSFLNRDIPIVWTPYKRNSQFIKEFDCDALQTALWFSEGNYVLERSGKDTLYSYTSKFGRMRYDATEVSKAFIFPLKFVKSNGTITHEQIEQEWDAGEAWKMLTERIGI
ncbi:MAG: metal-dependent hydrolase [Flavobacteriales bacterium]|nr:metal-dependent hydrolase [Flavobacteriales bacterium]